MRDAAVVPGLKCTLVFRGRPYHHHNWFDLISAVCSYRLERGADAVAPLSNSQLKVGRFRWPARAAAAVTFVFRQNGDRRRAVPTLTFVPLTPSAA